MKVQFGSIVPLCLSLACFAFTPAVTTLAQNQPGQVRGPHKYLYITNDMVRPGQAGAFYKTEADEVQALHAADAPGFHIGAVPISGGNDVVFFHGFDSFDELQKNHDATMAKTDLMARLHADTASEAPMLSDHFTSIYSYREDLSLNPALDLSQMRFFDIEVFHVRRGHHQDFERLAKLYQKASSSLPGAHWAAFEKMYGRDSGNTFIVITPLKSLAEVDQEALNGDKLPSTVGTDQMQVMRELGSETIESSESDLFAINPQICFVPNAWVTASPDFWGKKQP